MKKTLLIVFLALLCVKPPETTGFEYDPNLADYKVMGTVHTIPGESWHCAFNWQGGEADDIVILVENKPEGMYIDTNDWMFGWTPGPNDIGTCYVNFKIGKVSPADPNQYWISDRCTIVIRIEEWLNPPQFLPMCGG